MASWCRTYNKDFVNGKYNLSLWGDYALTELASCALSVFLNQPLLVHVVPNSLTVSPRSDVFYFQTTNVPESCDTRLLSPAYLHTCNRTGIGKGYIHKAVSWSLVRPTACALLSRAHTPDQLFRHHDTDAMQPKVGDAARAEVVFMRVCGHQQVKRGKRPTDVRYTYRYARRG
jgi:hypothetical protein